MKTITAHELKFWLDNNEAQVVDVREPSEYKEGHIPGSILIPLGTLNKEKLPHVPNKKIVIHCHFGKRGTMACQKLIIEDSSLDIYHLDGGLAAWIESGYEIER